MLLRGPARSQSCGKTSISHGLVSAGAGVSRDWGGQLGSHSISSATLDGGIGLLLPMQEKTYRRLLMLQNALTTMLPHHAGLNPRAFR